MSQSIAVRTLAEADERRTLVRANAGDRVAFGELYRRHHQAAWRMASVASGFTADAEFAVIQGVAAAFGAGGRTIPESARIAVLGAVRAAARERLTATGRIDYEDGSFPFETVGRADELIEPDDNVVRRYLRRYPSTGAAPSG